MRRAALILLGGCALAACSGSPIQTPIRSFDRPSDVALACSQLDFRAGRQVIEARPLSDCTPQRESKLGSAQLDPCNNDVPVPPLLRALVANSARGELALVDADHGGIFDINGEVPGFNFLPVGRLPEHVRTSFDGCRAVTANADSCDLAVVDLPVLYNLATLPFRNSDGGVPTNSNFLSDGGVCGSAGFLLPEGSTYGDNVVRRVQPSVNGIPLGARPSWIEIAPESDYTQVIHGYDIDPATGLSGAPGQCTGGSYQAWVALPGCQLVVEVDLNATAANAQGVVPAEVLRAIRLTPAGATVVSDLSTLSCPHECAGDSPSDAGAGAATDGGSPLPMTQSFPGSIAIEPDPDRTLTVRRMAIGDLTSERVTLVPLAARSGAVGTPLTIQLEAGALGVSTVRISPRTGAGKFLYAIARDASVRVVDLDRGAECETNPDPRWFQDFAADPDPSKLSRRFGCFPLGDPATPPRAPLVTTPGIVLGGGALPRDVAFVHLDVLPRDPNNFQIQPPAAGPRTMVGDFAWVIGSDGRATGINLFDACPEPNLTQPTGQTSVDADNYTPVCSQANVTASRQNVIAGRPLPTTLDRVAHRVRPASDRFFAPTSCGDQTTGGPRLQDEIHPYTLAVAGLPVTDVGPDGGVDDGGIVAPQLYPALVAQALPAPVSQPQQPTNGLQTASCIVLQRNIAVVDPDHIKNEIWTLGWEGAIPGSTRALGRPSGSADATLDPTGRFGSLIDPGANFCTHGVQAGDKVYLLGCNTDSDCGSAQTCVRDPGAPLDVLNGLCLDQGANLPVQTLTCGPLLRAVRRYRVMGAKQGPLSDGNTDELLLGEIYEPEHVDELAPAVSTTATPAPTTAPPTCVTDADCRDWGVPFQAVAVTDGGVALDGGLPLDGGLVRQTGTLPTACLTDADGVTRRCLRPCTFDGKPAVLNALAGDLADTGQCGVDYQCALPRVGGGPRCLRAPLDRVLIKACLAELEPYEIHVGDAFLVSGSTSGFLSDLLPNPAHAYECEPLPPALLDARSLEYARLHQSRIPISSTTTACTPLAPGLTADGSGVAATLPPSPLNPLARVGTDITTTPNVCLFQSAPDRQVRYENPFFTIGVDLPAAHLVPPDLFTLQFTVVGGGFPMLVALGVDVSAQQPRVAVTGPDGQTVFVVDEGKQVTATGLRGQLLKLISAAQGVDRSFIVR